MKRKKLWLTRLLANRIAITAVSSLALYVGIKGAEPVAAVNPKINPSAVGTIVNEADGNSNLRKTIAVTIPGSSMDVIEPQQRVDEFRQTTTGVLQTIETVMFPAEEMEPVVVAPGAILADAVDFERGDPQQIVADGRILQMTQQADAALMVVRRMASLSDSDEAELYRALQARAEVAAGTIRPYQLRDAAGAAIGEVLGAESEADFNSRSDARRLELLNSNVQSTSATIAERLRLDERQKELVDHSIAATAERVQILEETLNQRLAYADEFIADPQIHASVVEAAMMVKRNINQRLADEILSSAGHALTLEQHHALLEYLESAEAAAPQAVTYGG